MNKTRVGTVPICPLCNNSIDRDSRMCQYCGAVVAYDEESLRFYVSARICSKCGYENEQGASHCHNCGSVFTVVCPKCRSETQFQQRYCKRCGLRIDKFYLEETKREQLYATKVRRSRRMGLYFGGILVLLFALFFLLLAVDSGSADIIRTAAFTLGALMLFALLTAIGRSLFELKRSERQYKNKGDIL